MQVLAVAALALVGCFVVMPGAGATSATSARATQATTCDSAYGCPTTTPPPGAQATCSLDTNSARAGATVKATVAGAPANSEVSVSFDGNVVKTGTADASGNAAISFTVPSGASVGQHTVTVFGASFSCDATGGAGFSVLGGALSRTGTDVAKYLGIALILLVVGLQLVFMARRRRGHALHRVHTNA
jgi:hypothetical protein